MLDLFGNHIVGFSTRRLKYVGCPQMGTYEYYVTVPYFCLYELKQHKSFMSYQFTSCSQRQHEKGVEVNYCAKGSMPTTT